ncbi:peptide ABC transporter substrate-binding protein [Aliidongia dinghuensis]|uniref:Peptide ABC transporter substrate-binding protein n=1 Tax=Aliidongia dinghuensis TaxID=1867774 RepID=A0A8J2Z0Y7_9PROT|nr:ABC transporter substrate-binding protein [Aliidongia dinghuensis]GGF47244.1 peptide ABC transporter substrate-binding protein [Aliidongia dinghuensis]
MLKVAARIAGLLFVLWLPQLGLPQPALAEESTLQVGSGSGDVSTLDPHRASATGDMTLIGWIYSGLVRFKPGSADPRDIEPDLAESWEASADGRTWTFHLRKGVKFQGDWGELTADDVVYSLNRAADSKRSTFSSDFAAIESVAKLDDYTVRVALKYPDVNFLGRVSSYHGGNIISRKAAEKLGDDFGHHPVGTGPFAFVEQVTQQYVKLAANPDYFRGKPKIDTIIVHNIPSDSARELAFASGELDLMEAKREQRWVDSARKRRGFNVDIFRPGEYRELHINQTVPPLDDVRVRQAIAAAINVDDLVRFVGRDVGFKGCSVVPPGYLGEDCSVGSYSFDLAKAKALLAEAGHPDGFTVKAIVSNISAQQPFMEVIQAELAKVGIKLDMQVVDHPTYQSQIRRDLSGLVFYGAARFPIADTYLSEFFHSRAIVGTPTAASNFSHCKVADAEIEGARVAADAAAQLAMWKEAQRKIMADVCAVPLFELRQVWVHSDRLNYGYELKGAMNLAPPITEASTVKPR